MNHTRTLAALCTGAAIVLQAACGGADLDTSHEANPSSPSAPPAPAPTPSPAPAPTEAPASVSITDFGAVCNGSIDNTGAIARAVAAARRLGHTVLVPAGVCAYGDVIRLDGVKLTGVGDSSVLHALNPNREAIFLSGDGAGVSRVRLAGARSNVRQAAWEATRITAYGATNFVIDNVTIDGSAAAGIQTARAASNGRISNNRIRDTLSDSIHVTDRASHITITNNRIENSGDDGIAVVSYRSNGGVVSHVTARDNVVLNNRWGRQMSVVGGNDVLYENNRLDNNLAAAACLYVAQESGYATYGSSEVVLRRNSLSRCGGGSTGHGAVMLYSDGQEANNAITIERNDIAQSPRGIRIFSAMNTRVTVDSNRVAGASTPFDIVTPGVSFTPYTSGPVGYEAP
jgi:polygalacturonase